MQNSKSLGLIKFYLKKHGKIIFWGACSLVAVNMIQLTVPLAVKGAVDELAVFEADSATLFLYAVFISAVALVSLVLRYIWRKCLGGTARKIERDLRERLFAHIQLLSSRYFDRVPAGELMAHATNDITNVRMAAGMGMVMFFDTIFLGSAAMGFMFYMNAELACYALVPIPFMIICSKFFTKRMHSGYKTVQSRFAGMTETIRGSFAGIKVVKAYNRQSEQVRLMEDISRRYVEENLALKKITGSFFPIMVLLNGLSTVAVLWLGGRATILFETTPGEFVAFISYLGILSWPMMAFGWMFNIIQRGRASLDRINVILSEEPAIKGGDVEIDAAPENFSAAVSFQNTSFSYDSGEKPLLSGITFEARPGEILGIVGPPGCGKTTLASLIPRLYDASSGIVAVNGIDHRELTLESLRRVVSFMPQEPFIFAGTIRENILLSFKAGRLDSAGEKRLAEAVEKASLAKTVIKFSEGLETVVGEKGVMLSGGQKQRIALARIFFRDPAVMIFDEPVSQVDAQTAAEIIENIREAAKGRTVIIISHRISALSIADRIMVMENGRITESGTRRRLMEAGGYYAKAARLQGTGDEIPESPERAEKP